MSYRTTLVEYELLPRFNISSTPGTLPTLFRVPVQSQMLPGPSAASFTAFANVQVSTLKGPYRGSFKPLMYVDATNSSELKFSPLLETSITSRIMYGHTILL